jgi:hypothetical protein
MAGSNLLALCNGCAMHDAVNLDLQCVHIFFGFSPAA